jgi:tetratricopeptide (TPR) repeat protein
MLACVAAVSGCLWAVAPAAAQLGSAEPAELVRSCDLAVRAFIADRPDDAVRYLTVADRLSRMQSRKERASEQARAAQRGFFLIAAWIRTVGYDVVGATQVLDRASGEFPKDADILLARGVVSELTRRLAATGELTVATIAPRFKGAWVQDRRSIAEAADYYRRALEADPSCVEARVRLAHLALATEPDKARQELDAAIVAFDRLDAARRRRARRAEYVAHLLRGRLDADAGQWSAAAGAFARATALCDAPQSARVGQAYVALMSGNEVAARAQAASILRLASGAPESDACEGDPWNEYAFGDAWRMSSMVRDLHAMLGPQP